MSLNERLDGALFLASRELPVLPLWGVRTNTRTAKGLHPCVCRAGADCTHAGKHRLREGDPGTRDREAIRHHWRRAPWANVGVRTGAGLLVVDLDPRHLGDETWDWLTDHKPCPPSWETMTGGGGRHVWYRYDAATVGRVPCSVGRLGPGIDIRADGGLVVVPPSVHASGKTYGWELSSDPTVGEVLATAPDWLLHLVTLPAAPSAAMREFARKALRGADGVIPEGQRNDTLYRRACALRTQGLDAPELLEALTLENAARCTVPLDAREVEALVVSALRHAAGLSADYAARAAETAARGARGERLQGRYAFRDDPAFYTTDAGVPDDPEGGIVG